MEKQLKEKQAKIKQAEKEWIKLSSSWSKVEKNIQIYQTGDDWKLPEPIDFTSAGTYKEKKIEPLIIKLKDTIQTILIHNLDLSRKLDIIRNQL